MAIKVHGGVLRIFARVLELWYEGLATRKHTGFGLLKGSIRMPRGYQSWLNKYDNSSELDMSSATVRFSHNEPKFRISLVLAGDLLTEKRVMEVVNSVRFQSYRHWQLCIVSNALPAAPMACSTRRRDEFDIGTPRSGIGLGNSLVKHR